MSRRCCDPHLDYVYNLTSDLGHYQPFKISLAECLLLGVKQPLGNRILGGYDLITLECQLSPIAVIQFAWYAWNSRAAFGQKRPFLFATLPAIRSLRAPNIPHEYDVPKNRKDINGCQG
jgi:hypothetical protein